MGATGIVRRVELDHRIDFPATLARWMEVDVGDPLEYFTNHDELVLRKYQTEDAPPATDQNIKADAGKPRLSLVPTEIIRAIARIREYGNQKYGDSESWRKVDLARYRDAMYRHMLAYIEDPTGVDEESGQPHLWHLACNVAFLCEMEKMNEDQTR